MGGSVSFLTVAAVAGLIPALRAARTPPAVGLQSGQYVVCSLLDDYVSGVDHLAARSDDASLRGL